MRAVVNVNIVFDDTSADTGREIVKRYAYIERLLAQQEMLIICFG